jgi:hypothetical protein
MTTTVTDHCVYDNLYKSSYRGATLSLTLPSETASAVKSLEFLFGQKENVEGTVIGVWGTADIAPSVAVAEFDGDATWSIAAPSYTISTEDHEYQHYAVYGTPDGEVVTDRQFHDPGCNEFPYFAVVVSIILSSCIAFVLVYIGARWCCRRRRATVDAGAAADLEADKDIEE